MNNYNTQEACKILIDFFEVLNNWHIHHGRERFWKSDLDQDKTDAYNVLYTVFLLYTGLFKMIVRVLTTCHTQLPLHTELKFFIFYFF